jgi:hypothetical protein
VNTSRSPRAGRGRARSDPADRSGGPIAALPRGKRFHWLVAPRSAIIQTSAVHCERSSPSPEHGVVPKPDGAKLARPLDCISVRRGNQLDDDPAALDDPAELDEAELDSPADLDEVAEIIELDETGEADETAQLGETPDRESEPTRAVARAHDAHTADDPTPPPGTDAARADRDARPRRDRPAGGRSGRLR